MKMQVFGDKENPSILLIHGAGTSYNMWSTQIEVLKKDYYIYAPTLNGHVLGEQEKYESPEKEAEQIVKWFLERDIKRVHLICGASLGAMVAAEILLRSPDFAEYAFIESLKGIHLGKVGNKLFRVMGRYFLKISIRTKGNVAGSYEKEIVSEDMKSVLGAMEKESLDHILITTCSYDMKVDSLKGKIQAKTMIVYGEKEKKQCIALTKRLAGVIDDVEIICLKGYAHGELAIGNPERHLELLRLLMAKDEKR